MNTSLQKDIGLSEEERITRRRASAKRYMSRHQTMCVTLNEERDRDIIQWLDLQDNRAEAIRHVLRTYIGFTQGR